ncbi:hypothetical protein M9H77_04495 [Catharanthus roseus]|uniref:Uncharacterized protein n=1 Tax=Catharanthus roseus TaxID=4058 RepID=A0ACC0CEG6_CATRO|nr:hypothetical protein M9H77_04495 [Catharanthus roseus]
MEEVSAHVHLCPIVLDVLTRQHEHRSGLILSGDHETCFTDLQCSHMLPNFSGNLVHMRYLSLLEDIDAISTYRWVEVLSYPNDEYIRWHQEITRVYIENLANCNTRSIGYQSTGVDRRMMVHSRVSFFCGDIGTTFISLTNGYFCKESATIIRRCMVFIGGTLGCTQSQHDIQQTILVQPSCRCPRELVPDQGARGVKKGARILPGGGARGGRPLTPPNLGRGHADPGRGREMDEGSGGRGLGDLGSSYQVEPFDNPDLHMPSFSLGLTQPIQSHPHTSYALPLPDVGFSSFQSPHPPSIGSSSFQAPPPPYTVGSSTQHMPISTASSSDSDEHDDETTDVVTPVQHLGFGHRVVKKTNRFTSFDWP